MNCPKCTSTNIAGYEVQGVYDGVLFWLCQHCGWAFPRMFGNPRLDDLSCEYADNWNKGG